MSIEIKPLEWHTPPWSINLSRAVTIIGAYAVWTHHEANGRWFWRLENSIATEGECGSEVEARSAAQSDFDARIRSAIERKAEPVAWEDPETRKKVVRLALKHWNDDQAPCLWNYENRDHYIIRAAFELASSTPPAEPVTDNGEFPDDVMKLAREACKAILGREAHFDHMPKSIASVIMADRAGRMKLRFDNEWLKAKIASDGDCECEAGAALSASPSPVTVESDPVAWTTETNLAAAKHDPELALTMWGKPTGREHVALYRSAPPSPVGESRDARLPDDIIERLLAVGRVEWGTSLYQADEKHVEDFRDTLRITREHFATEADETAIHGVYLEGTGTVLAHTGNSPNSPQHARILVGAWNQLVDMALAAKDQQS
ncbi:hypothetical protein SJ05684_c10100 [Sinorhizobium sojae CCBAU 05684]|uniref:Uncharacterized protein n=1 Tax=Sinorhizobium sojae CCBAU 05684 TaxID=716928 RepID=A0A249P983_9HYPH|nr:hypothetical protein [Sinorhizobium sojae]ASY62468.1 hypothetical protein SJ05684_c10100 [Sinorhizobium sojae CCBAU 05684]